jgi:hypothetical protein
MTEIVKGLFGFTPQELATQRDQRDQASAMAEAKLSNTEFANYALSRGVGKLSRAVGGMMGAEDPEMKKASDLQGILKTGDFNTVEGALAMAKQAADMNYSNEAQQMYAHAQGLEKSSAELAYKKAQTAKELREADPKMKIAVAALPNNTATSIQAYMASGNIGDLERIDKNVAPTSAFIAEAMGMGFGDKSKYGDYTPAQVKAVNEALLAQETQKKRAGVQPIQDIGRIMEMQGARQTSDEQARQWAKAGDAYKTQTTVLPKLTKVLSALPNTFTGKFSDTVTQFGKALAGVGIPIDTTKISNTEYVNSVTAQLVRQIARDFPGSQSNAELQQLLLSKPSTQQEYRTIVSLLAEVQQEMKASSKTYERLSKLPLADRFKTDINSETGKTYKALTRYAELEAMSRTGKLTKEQAAEAKALEELIGN